MRVKKGVNKFGMPLICITRIDSSSDKERADVVRAIKRWIKETKNGVH